MNSFEIRKKAFEYFAKQGFFCKRSVFAFKSKGFYLIFDGEQGWNDFSWFALNLIITWHEWEGLSSQLFNLVLANLSLVWSPHGFCLWMSMASSIALFIYFLSQRGPFSPPENLVEFNPALTLIFASLWLSHYIDWISLLTNNCYQICSVYKLPIRFSQLSSVNWLLEPVWYSG